MTGRDGPIYEVTFVVAEADIAVFDSWLEAVARAARGGAAIADCQPLAAAPDDDGRRVRVCRFLLDATAPVGATVERLGTELEARATAIFGEHLLLTSRMLREDRALDLPDGQSPDCLNCGERLLGQYCGKCGQRSRSRLISLWELVSDAFGDLFELDSRLWQTLIPLVIRPGRLTHDYLQGRRARFMPPFRMYLVMSLLFFVVAFFDPREELSLLFAPELETTAEESPLPSEPEARSEAEQVRQEVLNELRREGILDGGDSADDSNGGVHFNFGEDDDGDCNVDQADVDDLPDWLARRLTVERLQRICERIRMDDGRAFLERMLDNVPAALIVLLPIMALVLKALYPLSRRYYVEHLLFFVHFHAFFFLMLTLQVLFARLANLLQLPDGVTALTLSVTSLYIPVYLFVAMRKVYGQGRLVTFLKYVFMVAAYVAGFSMTMAAAMLIAAMSA